MGPICQRCSESNKQEKVGLIHPDRELNSGCLDGGLEVKPLWCGSDAVRNEPGLLLNHTMAETPGKTAMAELVDSYGSDDGG
jgi:hypothetical protein